MTERSKRVGSLSEVGHRINTAVRDGVAADNGPYESTVAAAMILRVRELLLRRLDGALSGVGTSHAKFQVLSIVRRYPTGVQLSEIAAEASLHPTTMTGTIDRLQRDGLIERRSDVTDRRVVLAVVTPAGQRLYAKASAVLREIDYGLVEVDNDLLASLNDTLDTIASALEQQANYS